MAIEGFPSPEENNEDEIEKTNKAESDAESARESVDFNEKGVGKNAKKYVDGDDVISHRFSGPVREHLDEDTIKKLEKMKAEQSDKDSDDNDNNSKYKKAA